MDYRGLSRKDFRLEMLLGLGRFAQVYLARAPDGREVALKIPRTEVRRDPQLAQRFAQEVSLGLSISHPFLVSSLAGCPTGEGAYLALEFFPEGTLEERLATERLDRDEVLRLLHQIGSALIDLHRRGIVHQDVKPSNIFLRRGDFVLGDLGVAKVQGQSSIERAGSPFYMAPEVFAGQPTSPASDAYSLGILAFELLSGKRPFQGERLEDLAHAHLHLPLPPTPLPYGLDRPIRKLLIKNPSQRASLEDVLRELPPLPKPVDS